VAAAACVGVLLLASALYVRAQDSLKARLLMAVPDLIPSDAALMGYALPRGRAAFLRHCSDCHGRDARGDPGRGIPNLTDADWLYGSGRIGEIERIVLYGIRSGHSKAQQAADMPAFATAHPYARYAIEPLDPQQLSDVAGLVYSFQHRSAVTPESIARGTQVYHGKGLCFDCHSDHATGDPAIGAPNLTDGVWLYGDGSLESIKAHIARGLKGVCPAWASRLRPETIRAIAVYVHTLSAHPTSTPR